MKGTIDTPTKEFKCNGAHNFQKFITPRSNEQSSLMNYVTHVLRSQILELGVKLPDKKNRKIIANLENDARKERAEEKRLREIEAEYQVLKKRYDENEVEDDGMTEKHGDRTEPDLETDLGVLDPDNFDPEAAGARVQEAAYKSNNPSTRHNGNLVACYGSGISTGKISKKKVDEGLKGTIEDFAKTPTRRIVRGTGLEIIPVTKKMLEINDRRPDDDIKDSHMPCSDAVKSVGSGVGSAVGSADGVGVGSAVGSAVGEPGLGGTPPVGGAVAGTPPVGGAVAGTQGFKRPAKRLSHRKKSRSKRTLGVNGMFGDEFRKHQPYMNFGETGVPQMFGPGSGGLGIIASNHLEGTLESMYTPSQMTQQNNEASQQNGEHERTHGPPKSMHSSEEQDKRNPPPSPNRAGRPTLEKPNAADGEEALRRLKNRYFKRPLLVPQDEMIAEILEVFAERHGKEKIMSFNNYKRRYWSTQKAQMNLNVQRSCGKGCILGTYCNERVHFEL